MPQVQRVWPEDGAMPRTKGLKKCHPKLAIASDAKIVDFTSWWTHGAKNGTHTFDEWHYEQICQTALYYSTSYSGTYSNASQLSTRLTREIETSDFHETFEVILASAVWFGEHQGEQKGSQLRDRNQRSRQDGGLGTCKFEDKIYKWNGGQGSMTHDLFCWCCFLTVDLCIGTTKHNMVPSMEPTNGSCMPCFSLKLR